MQEASYIKGNYRPRSVPLGKEEVQEFLRSRNSISTQ